MDSHTVLCPDVRAELSLQGCNQSYLTQYSLRQGRHTGWWAAAESEVTQQNSTVCVIAPSRYIYVYAWKSRFMAVLTW